MNCAQTLDLFTAYSDRDLDEAAAARLEKHLAACADCAREWRHLKETLRCLHALEPVAAPPDLLPGIHEKLANPGLFRKLMHWLHHMDLSMSIPTAAATVAIALTAMFLVRTLPLDHESPELLVASHQGSASAPTISSDNKGGHPPRIVVNPTRASNHPGSPAAGRQSASRMFPRSQGEHPPSAFYSQGMPSALKPYPNIDYAPTSPSRVSAPPAFPRSASMPKTFSESHHGLIKRWQSPDITVTVRTPDTRSLAALAKALIKEKRWQAVRFGNNRLLITLTPDTLPTLQRTLARYNAVYSPAEAGRTKFKLPKGRLAVAVNLQ